MTIWFGLLTLIFTQFQNCANVHSSAASSASNGTVQIVDNFSKAGILFPESSVELADDATAINLGGICNPTHSGQSFEWSVSQGGSVVASGAGTCSNGQFQFDLANVSPWNCGVTYELTASGSWGEQTAMNVVKKCQPLASESVAAASTVQPLDCRLEYRLEAGQPACESSCYSQGILASLESKSLDQCSALIQKVSGR